MSKNPFNGTILGEIGANEYFMMLYYLPKGDTAGSQTSTASTYYTYWHSKNESEVSPNTARAYGLWAYKSENRGRPMAFTYDVASNGISFQAQEIYNYLNTNQSVEGDKYGLSEPSGVTHPSNYAPCMLVKDTKSQVYQLEQVNTNVPSDHLYSGVWYTMKSDGHQVIPLCYNLPTGIGGSPFPNEADSTMMDSHNSFLEVPWVMFVPIRISYYNKGTCTPPLTNSLSVLLISDWINTAASAGYVSQYKQLHCSTRYGSNSQWCANTGDNCNNNIGYTYCGVGKYCGNCFGKCNNKGTNNICTLATKGKTFAFYCSNQTNPDGPSIFVPVSKPKNSKEIKEVLTYAGIIGGSLILLIAALKLFMSEKK